LKKDTNTTATNCTKSQIVPTDVVAAMCFFFETAGQGNVERLLGKADARFGRGAWNVLGGDAQ
jgi:hypothetical protein